MVHGGVRKSQRGLPRCIIQDEVANSIMLCSLYPDITDDSNVGTNNVDQADQL
jgi:hypothetical protein